ncbi:MAG: tetratricopeptide repeat protein [Bacteroidales bacterium]|nr:tetratricopeptide repeat protein [Bacteroidales bacterium]MBN2749001.1 tetratricopeptide repeat protein [Bacteroidales bacterium]
MIRFCTILIIAATIWSCTSPKQQTSTAILNDSISIQHHLDSIEKYININDEPKAYSLTLKCLKEYSNTPYVPGKAMLLQRAATLNYLYTLNLDSSVFYLNQLRDLATQSGFNKGIIWYEHTLGKVYYTQNDYPKAHEFYSSAYRKAQELNDSITMADILSSLSKTLIQSQQHDSAKHYLRKALSLTRNRKLHTTNIMLYDRLASIYATNNQLDSALYYYNKALLEANIINNRLSILLTEFNIAYFSHLQNPRVRITDNLYKLLETAKNEGFYKVQITTGYLLSSVLEREKRYGEALQMYKSTRSIEDSLIGNERVRKVVEREAQFYINEKEVENQRLVQEAKIKALELRNRKIVTYFTVFTLILSILSLGVIVNKYKQIKANLKTIKEQERLIFNQERALIEKEKEAIEQRLDMQQRELTSKIMKLYQHKELISNTINQIEGIKLKVNKKGGKDATLQTSLQNLINELTMSDNENLWKEFEAQFNETNPDFLKRLTERFPDLTTNDIKMCIFLRLNLRTKEISVITQQSIKSIEVARTRLRKKLGLDNTSTNISLFLGQV